MPNPLPTPLVTSLQNTLDRTRAGSVGLVSGITSAIGEWYGSSGTEDIAGKDALETTDIFQIGSISKTVLATVILQLVEQGKLKLDDTLANLLPASLVDRISDSKTIQVRQLLNHTSGIYNHVDILFENATSLFRDWTAEELIAIAYDNSYDIPGRSWNYSNTNYILLGEIVEAVTGRSLSSEIRDRILTPLGMKNTFFATEEDAIGGVVPAYWDIDNDGKLNDVSFLGLTWAGAAGNIVSNAQDLTKFGQALFDGTLLKPASLSEMLTLTPTPGSNTFNGYGLGIAKLRSVEGNVYGHNGLTLGHRANFWVSPDEKLTYVDLQNTRVFTNFATPLINNYRLESTSQIIPVNMSQPQSPNAPVFAWADSFGSSVAGPEQQQGYRTTIDAQGNVFTIGQFENTTQFNTVNGVVSLTPPINPGKGDIFITKHTTTGDLQWVKQFGGPQRDLGWDIAIDRSGNILHTGSFDDTADFNPGAGTLNLTVPNFSTQSAARRSGYVSKLDSAGNVTWAVQIASGLDNPTRIGANIANSRIGTDAANNIYVSGYFQSNRKTDFNWLQNQGANGASVLGSDATGITNAAFIAKYDANGQFQWVKQQGGNRSTQANSIVVDNAGNSYTIGSFRGTEDFDPSAGVRNLTTSSNTDADIYISKLDAQGKLLWAKQMGGTGTDEGNDITLDAQGNLFITGGFTSSNFRYNPNDAAQIYNSVDGKKDIFVTKLNGNGDVLWSKQIGGAENQDGLSLATDTAGNVYYSGEFKGTVDFDASSNTSALTSSTAIGSFVSKLSSDGSFQWALPLNGTSATLSANDIAVNAAGSTIATTGYFSSANADLDPGPGLFNPTYTEARDAFVTQLQLPNPAPVRSGWNPGAVVRVTAGFDPVAAEQIGLFQLTSLGTLGGKFSQAFDINNQGQIAGWANDSSGNRRPAIWENGQWRDLGTPSGTSGQAQGINDRGQATGFVDSSATARSAILWNGSTTTNLGNLGASFAAGYGINNAGTIAGVSRDAIGTDFNPFLWNRTNGIANLRTAPSTFDFAWDINNLGQVAGYSTVNNDNKPTVWKNGQAIVLPDLGGGFGNAQGINDLGKVVGFSGNSLTNASARVATLWDLNNPTRAVNLGTLGGTRSTALRINNLNQIVGWSRDTTDQTRATLWQNDRTFNLNNLVTNSTDWNLTFAWGINDRGAIVGYGDYQGSNPSAFVLNPLDLSGDDTVYGTDADEALYGGAGNDILYANEGNNYLFGGAGDDKLYGGSGNDIFYGGEGNDVIFGNEGVNTIDGGNGDNVIFGGSSRDVITGGSGNDIIYANEGVNFVNAGTGNDSIYFGSSVDTLQLNRGEGSATIFGGFNSSDKLSLGVGLRATDLAFTFQNGDTLVKAGDDLLATIKWTQVQSNVVM